MNVWNKVLMALTTLVCVAFCIFAANKYQLAKDSEQKLESTQAELDKTLEEVQKLSYEVYGDPDKPIAGWTDLGLNAQLDYMRSLENGDVFTNCQAGSVSVDDADFSSKVTLGVDARYNMASFRTNSIVFLFDSGSAFVAKAAASDSEDAAPAADEEETTTAAASKPYVFLGAFKVIGTNASQVNLESTGRLSADELALMTSMKKSGDSFVACVDRLPVDSPADIAKFYNDKPELFAGFDADTTAFLAKDAAASAEIAAAVVANDDEGSVANFFDLFQANLRAPVAYQAALESQWTERDATNVLIARNTAMRDNLDVVIGNQIATMGDKASKDLEQGYENCVALASALNGWDDIYAAAKNRRKNASYFELVDASRASIAKTNANNELLKSFIEHAEQNNTDCQKAIDELIAENARLAEQIAGAQYAAADKIQDDSATASSNTSVFAGI